MKHIIKQFDVRAVTKYIPLMLLINIANYD